MTNLLDLTVEVQGFEYSVTVKVSLENTKAYEFETYIDDFEIVALNGIAVDGRLATPATFCEETKILFAKIRESLATDGYLALCDRNAGLQ